MLVQNKSVYRRESHLRGFMDMMLEIPVEFRGTPMIEIGSAFGESTRLFSLFFSPVYSVDPLTGNRKAHAREIFMKTTAGRNIINIPKLSNDAVNDVPGEVSFVYIDGNHNAAFVEADIKNYLPKIRKGGYIGGHDYGSRVWKDVAPVVKKMLGEPDMIFIDQSWLKKINP